MTRFEPTFDEKIILGKDLSPQILMERIKQRNRQDETVDVSYLQKLNEFYKDFIQEDNTYPEISNQIYIIGSIAVGKTTLTNQLQKCCRTQIEHLAYWSY